MSGTAPITPPVLLLLLSLLSPPVSLLSASYPSEPPEEHHIVQHLGPQNPSEPAPLGFPPLAVDGAMAHHLHRCPYHLRLFTNWLVSGQEPPMSLHGQPQQTKRTSFYLPPPSGPVQPASGQVGHGQCRMSFAYRSPLFFFQLGPFPWCFSRAFLLSLLSFSLSVTSAWVLCFALSVLFHFMFVLNVILFSLFFLHACQRTHRLLSDQKCLFFFLCLLQSLLSWIVSVLPLH